ncbi:hypothetical protein EOD39_8096 [Acipenser ruthenus]|uniref:Uncharacterized protein n=1 Tax=Acipenser ruthenus TaxID=7906 RepID=A0A662YWT1_ACIRT|nr:hypothetical protein EOD39_8096 [Acipenser ruthenus]
MGKTADGRLRSCPALMAPGAGGLSMLRPDIFQWVGETSRAKVAPTAVQIQTVTGQLFPMRGSKLLQLHLGEVWIVDISGFGENLDLARGKVTARAGLPLLLAMATTNPGATVFASLFNGSWKWHRLLVKHWRKAKTVATAIASGLLFLPHLSMSASPVKGSCKGRNQRAEHQQRAGVATDAIPTDLPFPT